MSDGLIDVVVHRITAVDHQPVDELHRLGTLTAQFAGHDHLAALGAALHDETQHTVACSAQRIRTKTDAAMLTK